MFGSVAKILKGSERPIDLKIKQPGSKKFPPGFGEDLFDFSSGLSNHPDKLNAAEGHAGPMELFKISAWDLQFV